MKTAELKGDALDWAVCKASGTVDIDTVWELVKSVGLSYSTDWAYGGRVIEREKIALHFNGDSPWVGECGWARRDGATPLEAAMRSYVAVKLGDDVEIPKELVKQMTRELTADEKAFAEAVDRNGGYEEEAVIEFILSDGDDSFHDGRWGEHYSTLTDMENVFSYALKYARGQK